MITNFMAKEYKIIILEKDFELILIALEKCYWHYNDGIEEQDVYEHNTEIDKVIRNLINQTKGEETDEDE